MRAVEFASKSGVIAMSCRVGIALVVLGAVLPAFINGYGQAADLPRNSKAREAILRRDAAARKLRSEYYAKLVEADLQLVKDLDVAIKVAASAGAAADEIEQIVTARAVAQSNLKRDTEEGQGMKLFSIKADGDWQETVDLHKGDSVLVEASGTWTWDRHGGRPYCGPDGTGPGSPAQGALIGVFSGQGDETAIQIGTRRQFVAGGDGKLKLGMKGHSAIGSGRNDGALQVLIKVTPASE